MPSAFDIGLAAGALQAVGILTTAYFSWPEGSRWHEAVRELSTAVREIAIRKHTGAARAMQANALILQETRAEQTFRGRNRRRGVTVGLVVGFLGVILGIMALFVTPGTP